MGVLLLLRQGTDQLPAVVKAEAVVLVYQVVLLGTRKTSILVIAVIGVLVDAALRQGTYKAARPIIAAVPVDVYPVYHRTFYDRPGRCPRLGVALIPVNVLLTPTIGVGSGFQGDCRKNQGIGGNKNHQAPQGRHHTVPCMPPVAHPAIGFYLRGDVILHEIKFSFFPVSRPGQSGSGAKLSKRYVLRPRWGKRIRSGSFGNPRRFPDGRP